MKFTNGYWLLRDGVSALYARQAVDTELTARRARITVLTRPLEHRGSVLNAPSLTVDLSAPMPDVIAVKVSHHLGARARTPAFDVADEGADLDVEQSDGTLLVRSGRLEVVADLGSSWGLTFRAEGRDLTSSGLKSMAAMTTEDGSRHIVDRLALGVGTSVYGLGERFTSFVKNGQAVESWNEDGGTASEQAYKAVPFYLTDQGYGVFVNTPGRVSFEVASEVVSGVQFSTPGTSMEYLVIHGRTPKEILRRYGALVGRPALPPQWSFGLWLSTSFTTDYDEATVSGFVDGMRDRDLPVSVFHFDCYWMRALQWCDFEWDPAVFPDPAAMLQRLKERGIRICVWINPYLGQKSPLFAEAAQRGYLVRRPDGDIWQWDMWVAGMGLVDFTNPAAAEWYAGKVRALLDMGVDTVKTDFGERIPTDVVWHDGADPERMHNYYTFLYNSEVFQALEAHRGHGDAVVFARSATAGSQRFPVHWGGDCESTWVAMAESLRGGLSLSLSGFGFWSHDIGGFEGTPSPALFKRWAAFGLLSSHSRLHGSDSYRVPWAFDDEAVDVVRRFTKLKHRLMPYLWAAAVEAHRDGVPMMRPMMLEFPDDPAVTALDRQYMLGQDLLVAPVMRDDGRVTYYVPDGSWTNILTGHVVRGPRWVTEEHGYTTLPLLARPGSVIAVGGRDDRPDYDYADGVTLEVYAPLEGEGRVALVHDQTGEQVLAFDVQTLSGVVRATPRGAAPSPWSLRVIRPTDDSSASGSTEAHSTGGTGVLKIHAD